MEKVAKVVWGIIGAGDVCEVKSAPAMYSLSNSEVKMIMRRNATMAFDFAKRHGINSWTTDLEELLSDTNINAVYIATPPDSHAALTIRCAKAGKAVYVEKPMANSYSECLSMINACKQANVPLFVAYYRRALPGFLKIKEIIDSGALGEIRFVNIEMIQSVQPKIVAQVDSNWRVHPEISGGGYFHDLASHQLDFLDYIFGPIVESNGITCNQGKLYPADDIVTASFRFEKNVIGSGLWCFSSDPISEKDSTQLVGSKGQLSFNTYGSPMRIQLETAGQGKQEFSFTHSQPVQLNLIQQVVDELCGKGISPSSGISGARTTLVMDKICGKIF